LGLGEDGFVSWLSWPACARLRGRTGGAAEASDVISIHDACENSQE